MPHSKFIRYLQSKWYLLRWPTAKVQYNMIKFQSKTARVPGMGLYNIRQITENKKHRIMLSAVGVIIGSRFRVTPP
jgi:hypothetical protein